VILDFNLKIVSRAVPWHCTKRTTPQAGRAGSPWRECVRCKCHCHRVCTHVARRPLAGTAPNFRRELSHRASQPTFLYWLNAQRLRALKLRDVSSDLHKISGGVRSPDEFEDDFSEGDGFDRTTLEFLMTNILTIKLQIRALKSNPNWNQGYLKLIAKE